MNTVRFTMRESKSAAAYCGTDGSSPAYNRAHDLLFCVIMDNFKIPLCDPLDSLLSDTVG
jgi:hypothetical protein